MSFSCRRCDGSLVLQAEPDQEDGQEFQTIPDDLELRCGCHFHWQCLLDQSSEVMTSLKCPACQTHLVAGQPEARISTLMSPASEQQYIWSRYVSEGGIEDNLDILPIVKEEAYISAHPETRPARAYHLMCSEGDVEGILELLQDTSRNSGYDTIQLGHLLRYRDPLVGGKSGLHLAIENSQDEVVWLLLWLASSLLENAFPSSLRQIADSMNVERIDISGADIRALQTDAGLTAEDIARAMSGPWDSLLQPNVLRA